MNQQRQSVMKRILQILSIVLLSCNLTIGAEVQLEKAIKVARNFLAVTHEKKIDTLFLAETVYDKENPLCYFLNFPDGKGFIVIAANEKVEPVLAYSNTHAYDENYPKPPQYIAWMNNYYDQIRYAIDHDVQIDDKIKSKWLSYLSDESKHSDSRSGSVSPLLSTTWGQGCNYNAMCPVDVAGPCGRVVVGCVAVAMGQIMKLHNWPVSGIGSHSYNHPTYGILSADFGLSNYNWSNMLNSSGNESAAELLYHCGVAVEMDYGPNQSGAFVFDAADAFKEYFRYADEIQVWLKEWLPEESWEDKLKENLDVGLPILYAGSGSGGHAWVLDGYQNTNHFHMNWGWNGNFNGYFYLSDLTPGGHSFNISQMAILNIQPDPDFLCNEILSLGEGGPQNAMIYVSEGPGIWQIDACGFICYGSERIYSFVAPLDGIYKLEVTSTNTTFVDYFWKTGSCDSTGWQCIDDVIHPGTYGAMNWTEGTTYYILLAAETESLSQHEFQINFFEEPGTWKGLVNSNWHESANWSDNTIPNILIDVTIPSGTPHQPNVSGEQASCKSLAINLGATLTIGGQDCIVQGDVNISGCLTLNNASGSLRTYGNVFWQSTSLGLFANNATIYLKGDWDCAPGSTTLLETGTVEFFGTGNSQIISRSNDSYFNHVINNKTGTELIYNTQSTYPLRINGNLYINPGCSFSSSANQNIIIKGFMDNDNGVIEMNNGAIVFEGAGSSSSFMPGDFLNDVVINSTGTSTFNNNIEIKGNLIIQAGVLSVGSNAISIKGNWTNNAFPTGFDPGTGRVIFSGLGHQYVQSRENFHILEAAMGAALRIENAAHTVTCSHYDWTSGGIDVIAGTFTALDLMQDGIMGEFYVNPGATINLHQQNGESVDLRCKMVFNGGGTINIHADAEFSHWPHFSTPAEIIMNAGVLDFNNTGIVVASQGTLTANISGGIIRTRGYFDCFRDNFNPTGGTFELYGNNMAMVSHTTGSFFNMMINKTNDGMVKLNSNININRNLEIVEGSLDLNSFQCNVGLTSNINGKIIMADANDRFESAILNWNSGSSANVTTGSFHVNNWRFNEGATAILGTGNTAYVNILTFPYSNEAGFGNLVMGPLSRNDGETSDRNLRYPVRVAGNFTALAGASLNYTIAGAHLIVDGNTNIHEDAEINFSAADFITVGSLTLNGAMRIYNGRSAEVADYINVNEFGLLSLTNGSSLSIHTALTVGEGGTFEAIGTESDKVLVHDSDGYHYEFVVGAEGVIRVSQAIFKNMNQDGIQIMPDAYVDESHSFDHCTFMDGAAGGTLLSINNNQALVVSSSVFPENSWGGLHNVSKVANMGNVLFLNAYGGFSGNTYEFDPHNRIEWNCAIPANLSASDHQPDQVTLHWGPGDSETMWNVEIGLPGFIPGTGDYITIVDETTSNPLVVSNLIPGSYYDYSVQAICENLTSEWSDSYNFYTPHCLTTNLPYFQNFDEALPEDIPECMIVTNNNSDAYTWLKRSTNPNSPPNSFWIRHNTYQAMNDWFFTPGLMLLAGETYKVEFYYCALNSSYPESLRVMWGTAPNSNDMIGGVIWENSNIVNTNYEMAQSTFTPETSGVYYLGWHGYSNANMRYLFIDDITIDFLVPINRIVDDIKINDNDAACFDASDNITVSNTTINDGGAAEFRAGVSIRFLEGFVANAGAYVHALITNEFCTQPESILLSQVVEEKDLLASNPVIKPSFTVFPNPGNGRFTVKTEDSQALSAKFCEIYNMLGILVTRLELSEGNTWDMDISGLPAGNYVIRLFVNNETSCQIIVKQ